MFLVHTTILWGQASVLDSTLPSGDSGTGASPVVWLCSPGLQPLHPSSQEQRSPLVLSRWSACHLPLAEAPALSTVDVKKEPPQKSTTNLHLFLDHYSLFSSAKTSIWTTNTRTLMQASKQLLVIKGKKEKLEPRQYWAVTSRQILCWVPYMHRYHLTFTAFV